jgi:hypothetical protein
MVALLNFHSTNHAVLQAEGRISLFESVCGNSMRQREIASWVSISLGPKWSKLTGFGQLWQNSVRHASELVVFADLIPSYGLLEFCDSLRCI